MEKTKLSLEDALTTWILQEYPYSVISKERLSEEIFLLYKTKTYDGMTIRQLQKENAEQQDYNRQVEKLLKSGILSKDAESQGSSPTLIPDGFFYISGKPKVSAAEIICSLYPYGYISHLSAMDWYGLTDKMPKVVRFTTCNKTDWKNNYISEFADKFGSSKEYKPFVPRYPQNNLKFDSKKLSIITNSSMPPPLQAKGSAVRVSSIGNTFLDMTKKPDFCGGIDHVIEVFIENGKKFSKNIIEATDVYGNIIDKARIGFLLDVMLKIEHKKLDEWKKQQVNLRGSSRVFHPSEPFSSIYNADWSLSLNCELLEKYGNKH